MRAPAEHVASFYAASTSPQPQFAVLSDNLRVDACIVGGGFTGLSAALHLAERGYRVALLEANRIGWGGSGRNGGQALVGYSPGMLRVVELVGEADARGLWDFSLEAMHLQQALIERHDIDCARRNGYLLAATRRRHLPELAEELDLVAGRWGYDKANLVDADRVRGLVDSPRFVGGLRDLGGGHLNPLKLCLGLCRIADDAGVQIFEQSPARRFIDGQTVTIDTDGGSVRANHLLLCGNAYLEPMPRAMRGEVMPVGTYIAATEPLGADRARALIPDDLCVSDTNMVLDYFRLSEDRRLLFGGRVAYHGRDPRDLAGAMRGRILATFPQLADVGLSHVWGGHVAITRNRLPRFGRLSKNVFYAHGFSGQGVTLTGLAGQILAEMVAGTNERFDLFARIPHKRFPGGALLRRPMLVLATSWYRLRDLL